ncbi:beta-1,3-galactosyltransferase 5-like [Asterias amurensis]|uniref:beta-1,3-galactosyltransferase 5-like n=1 Tax=Asterias amurensis TaxID=7602 RepID=UPI003AB6D054
MEIKTTFCFTLIYGLLVFGVVYFVMRRDDNLLLAQRHKTLSGVITVSGSRPTTARKNITMPRPTNKQNKTIDLTTVEPVVNPHRFEFTIHNQAACFNRNNSDGELFLVLLVKCATFEKLDREQIRKTWGGVKEVLGRRVLTMFLLGESTDPIIRKQIQEENREFHDLIQEDFIDAYTNLTYKNMMGLKWVSMYCPQTSFVFSVDTDMMINIVTLVKRLSTMPKTSFAEGHLRTDVIVERGENSKWAKWYIPKEVYAPERYPPFLNGACYAMSRDVAVRVFDKSKYVPFLRLDDAFVGITMNKTGIIPRFSPMYEQYSEKYAEAMKKGIGVGILHNRHRLNDTMLSLWHKLVGSQI